MCFGVLAIFLQLWTHLSIYNWYLWIYKTKDSPDRLPFSPLPPHLRRRRRREKKKKLRGWCSNLVSFSDLTASLQLLSSSLPRKITPSSLWKCKHLTFPFVCEKEALWGSQRLWLRLQIKCPGVIGVNAGPEFEASFFPILGGLHRLWKNEQFLVNQDPNLHE